jgi:hypothetical protein
VCYKKREITILKCNQLQSGLLFFEKTKEFVRYKLEEVKVKVCVKKEEENI